MSSFGEELKRERELRQITLREISEATKISLRYLDALERNDFRHLPGGVFNKGFVRAYAEYIGVDPEAMVNAYLLEQQGQEGRDRAETARRPVPSAEPDGGVGAEPGVGPRRRASVSVVLPAAGRRRAVISAVLVLIVVVALVGFFVVWLWPKLGRGEPRVSPSGSERTSAEVASPGRLRTSDEVES